MNTIVGRIVHRGDKLCGVFIPFGEDLGPGIYDVVMSAMDDGHYYLRYIGQPALEELRLKALDIQGVFDEKPSSIMTQEEIKQIND